MENNSQGKSKNSNKPDTDFIKYNALIDSSYVDEDIFDADDDMDSDYLISDDDTTDENTTEDTFDATSDIDDDNADNIDEEESDDLSAQAIRLNEAEKRARLRESEERERIAKQKEYEEKERIRLQKEAEEKERIRLQQEAEEKERIRLQKEAEEKERIRLQKEAEEKERIRLQQEAEEKERIERARKAEKEKLQAKFDAAKQQVELEAKKKDELEEEEFQKGIAEAEYLYKTSSFDRVEIHSHSKRSKSTNHFSYGWDSESQNSSAHKHKRHSHGIGLNGHSKQSNSHHGDKPPRFWSLLLAILIVGIAVIIVGAIIFWLFIRSFEISRPEHLIKEYMRTLSVETITKIIDEEYGDFYESEFESRELIVSALKDNIAENGIIYYKKADENTDSNPVFTVASEERELLRVEFTPNGSDIFGFGKYTDADASLIADFSDLKNDSLIIKAPQNTTLTLNGVKVTDNYLEATEEYSVASSFEAAENVGKMNVFNIKGLYCTPNISVTDSDGNEYTVFSSDEKAIVYDYPDSMRHSYNITVSEGCSVTVNGYKLDESFAAEKNIPIAQMSEYNKNAAAVPTLVKYTLPSLITYPKVVVTDKNGTVIQPESNDKLNFVYGYPNSELKNVRIIVPDDTSVTVNGIGLGQSDISEKELSYNNIEGIDAAYYTAPAGKKVAYSVNGLYYLPQIEVKNKSGEKLLPLTDDSGTNGVIIYDYAAKELPTDSSTQLGDYVKHFIDGYIVYYTGGRSSIYNNFNNYVAPYVLRDSVAYDELYSVLGTLRWSNETTVTSKTVNVYNFASWSDTCFSCYVDFKLEANTFYDFKTEVKAWELFFVRKNGKWLISKMLYHL